MRIFGKDVETHPTVPAPLPFKKFMVYIGPAMMTIALGLGTSELILYPRLTAEFGTGWIGLMVLSFIFQTVWVQEMARWTVVCGEHGARCNARIISSDGRARFDHLLHVHRVRHTGLGQCGGNGRAGTPEMAGGKVEIGTVFWAYLSFILVFLIIFFSKVARQYIERMATWATLAGLGPPHHRGLYDDQPRQPGRHRKAPHLLGNPREDELVDSGLDPVMGWRRPDPPLVHLLDEGCRVGHGRTFRLDSRRTGERHQTPLRGTLPGVRPPKTSPGFEPGSGDPILFCGEPILWEASSPFSLSSDSRIPS